MSSPNLYELRSSIGFGEVGPEVMTERCGISVVFIRSSLNSTLPERYADRPVELSRLKILCSLGLRISASITTTFASDLVKLMAVFIAVVVFPSSLAGLVTAITLGGFPPVERSRNVLIELYASAIGLLLAPWAIYSTGRLSLLSG